MAEVRARLTTANLEADDFEVVEFSYQNGTMTERFSLPVATIDAGYARLGLVNWLKAADRLPDKEG